MDERSIMDTWKTLIDTAAELCGSQNRLAQRLGYDPSQLSRVKRGAPMPLTMAGELADVLGPDYDAAIARCLTEQEPPGRKRDAVARLLRVPATLAAALITSATLISPDISQAKAHATGDALRGFVSYVNFLIALRRYLGTLRRQRHRPRLHHTTP